MLNNLQRAMVSVLREIEKGVLSSARVDGEVCSPSQQRPTPKQELGGMLVPISSSSLKRRLAPAVRSIDISTCAYQSSIRVQSTLITREPQR